MFLSTTSKPATSDKPATRDDAIRAAVLRPLDCRALAREDIAAGKRHREGENVRAVCPSCGSGAKRNLSVGRKGFRCHKCGERGNAIDWLNIRRGMSWDEAVRYLGGDPTAKGQGPDTAAQARRLEFERAEDAEAAQVRAKRELRRDDILAALRPITGSPAEWNLIHVRKIPEPPEGWPDSVRYYEGVDHKGRPERAIAFKMTDVDGRVGAVQLVYVTLSGENVRLPGGKKSKLTFGFMADCALRLPQRPGAHPGETMHGEGAETCLSAWIARGSATRAYMGTVPEWAVDGPGLHLILRDDDPAPQKQQEITKAQRIRETTEGWLRSGHCIVEAWPYLDRRGNKHDFNNVLIDSGPAVVAARLAAAVSNVVLPALDVGALVPIATARALTQTTITDWMNGGPQHLLVDAGTGTGKTYISIEVFAALAKLRREDRLRFIQDYRRDHHSTKWQWSEAEAAADKAGLQRLRALYAAETHALAGETATLARSMFLTVEHHGGNNQPYDPADPTSPPICSQPERLKQTEIACESVPDVACGRKKDATPCPDFSGCRKWQRLANCARAELVVTTIDNLFAIALPRELRGFDFIIIDEALDRAGRSEIRVPLKSLADHMFGPHPCRVDDVPDDALTEEARAGYARVRAHLNNVATAPNTAAYAPVAAMRADGMDQAFFMRLVDLTNHRDRPSGMTSATPDQERAEMAGKSIRREVRHLCALFRSLAVTNGGNVHIDDSDTKKGRQAVVTTFRTLHESVLESRILALDGSADLKRWQRFIPDIEAVVIPRAEAPHETIVQFMAGSGHDAMRDNPNVIPIQKTALKLYRSLDNNGVLTFKTHIDQFEGPGIIPGTYGALNGRNDWKTCSTVFAFGLLSLSPKQAAYMAAAETDEPIPIEMPVKHWRGVRLKDGSTAIAPTMDFRDPAIQSSQESVRERSAIQGIGGRPRAPNRTEADPLLTIYVGTTPIPGKALDALLTQDNFAPWRAFRMIGADLVVESGPDRHRLHPEIYAQEWTAHRDARRETGGIEATTIRVLFPAWWRRHREAWVTLRYWIEHSPGNRKPGLWAACPAGKLAEAKDRLRECCGATRFEVTGELHRPAELPTVDVIKQRSSSLTPSVASSPEDDGADDFGPIPPGVFNDAPPAHPPDG